MQAGKFASPVTLSIMLILSSVRRAARSVQASSPKAAQPSATVEASKSSNTRKPETKPARQPDHDHSQIIETMRAKHLRPKITKTEAGLELTLSKADAALFDLPADLVIADVDDLWRTCVWNEIRWRCCWR